MSDVKKFTLSLFQSRSISVPQNRQTLFDDFINEASTGEAYRALVAIQNKLMNNWTTKNRIADLQEQQVLIPNGTIGKPYLAVLNFGSTGTDGLIIERVEGLTEMGLSFHKETNTIDGTPTLSGDRKISLLFKVAGEDDDVPAHTKTIVLVINPDPKSLWKDLASDKNDPFWKEDDVAVAGKLGEKHIVVASKRGRSHKNAGSFRDDDFAFKHCEKEGWSVVVVSDGAGSATLSRNGSQVACKAVIDYFDQQLDKDKLHEAEAKLMAYNASKDESLLKETEVFAKQTMYKATVFVHNKLKEHAAAVNQQHPHLFNSAKAKTYLDYFHATLIFALIRKFDFGYVVLTFGVGDCPVVIMDKDKKITTLLNKLDVGEFGGGTRFITQPDIFHATEIPMASRFSFHILPDFSYLFLMTDGIYDPKFVVEANLEKNEKWTEFLDDLQGKNEDNIKVDFDPHNPRIAEQLSTWMDFWSPGNHDDRTLAIVY